MPTFSPPLRDGYPATSRAGSRVANALMRHYGANRQGATVWKDSLGNWHESLNPYEGGATDAVHNQWVNGVGPISTTTGPDEGLATATEVYLGGHVTEITEAKAAELIAAGFQIGGHFDSEEQKWVTYATNSLPAQEYKGGDGCSSLLRPDDSTVWVFADTLIGTNTADGFYIFALPFRNSLVVQNAAGIITNQAYASGGNGPAFANPTPDHWWWPIDIINTGTGLSGDVVVAAWDVGLGGTWGHLHGNELLTLNFFAQVSAITPVPSPDESFMIQTIYNDDAAGFHYILGLEFDRERGGYDTYSIDTDTYTRIARVPIGSLLTVASWEYWDATTSSWVAAQSRATRLLDSHGNQLRGDADLTRVGDEYIMARVSVDCPDVRMYRSTTPQGPWRLYHVESAPKAPQGNRDMRGDGHYAYYLPKFHEHFDPSATTKVVSYNRNIFPPGAGLAQTEIHVSTFCPQFVYVPTP